MTASFGTLLRRHRTAAALTQERLAERAGISAAGVAALEAGRRRAPRLSTVALLVDALVLDADQRAELLAAASGGPGPVDGSDGQHRATTRPSERAASGHQRPASSLGGVTIVDRRYSFVGRPHELARLSAAWSQRTRIVLVHGEAGIGKTRLAGEFATMVHDGAATVLWGRCTSERLGAYEPFVEPIRTAVRTHGDTVLIGRGELVRLLPELATATVEPAVPSRADHGVERRLLFEAVAGLLAALGPVLLVLDDLQWADPGSMALVASLAGAPRLQDLVVVGLVRSTDLSPATASALFELRRRTTFERINLSGLGLDDVSRLVELVAGRVPPRALVETVVNATDGNPLFVEELTEHLVQGGFDDAPGSLQGAVPDGVRATLVHRVAGLAPDAQALLRAGAVLGRDFDPYLAGALAGLTSPRLLAAIEDALLSALVTEPSARSLSFSHALVRTTVYEAISVARRVEIHRQAAVRLEEAGPATSAEIVDLVHHWSVVAAADPAVGASAARWAVRAGDAATGAAAMDEAIACYQQAVGLGSLPRAEHADALIRLGTSLSASGRRAEADGCFRAAFELADDLGDAPLVARAALGLSAEVRYGRSDPERVAALEAAIAGLGPDDAALRPVALAMLMRQLGFDPSPAADRRRREAAELVLQAVSVADVPAELLLAMGSVRDSIPVDEPVALGRLTGQIIDVATVRRDLPVLANAWYGQAWAALELGDAEGWDRAVAGYAEVASVLRLPYELALTATMHATAALIRGDYARAETSAHEALSYASSSGDDNASAVHLTNSVLRGLDVGDAAEMLALMRAVRADYVNVPTFSAGLTLTAAVAGDLTFAAELLDEQAVTGFDTIRRDAEWLPVVGFYSCAAAIVGDRRHAQRLHDLLVTSPARTVRVGPLAGWWGPIDHHLGALCRAMGRLDEAEQRLESALVVEDAMSARPFRARSLLELARVLDETGGSARRGRASELRREGATLAVELGAAGIAAGSRMTPPE